MPELPEVETIRRDLATRIVGLTIRSVRIGDPRVVREPDPAVLAAGLAGRRVSGVARRGKFLILHLNARDLVVLPRMTGQLVYGPDSPRAHLRLRLSDGRWLTYSDQRKFGEVRLVDDWRRVRGMAGLGPEPLNGAVTEEVWRWMLRSRRARIKPLLLQQGFIAGIGNIYAQEALFLAGIRPTRRSDTLSRVEADRLLAAIRRVLREGIRRRGVSARNYVDGLGRRGMMQNVLRVYRKGGRPCPRCGASLTARAIGQRGTVWCPRCQK